MNYFKNKKQIVMAMMITLSVISSISHASNNECFPAGQELIINTKNISDWYNPYMYMFGTNDTWIKMEKHIKNNYFIGIVPDKGKYSGLIFTSQYSNTGNWKQCRKQTVDLKWIKKNNCFTINNGSEKLNGNWSYENPGYYPNNTTLYLDITNIKDWNNPYIYLFGPSNSNTWVKMKQYIEKEQHKYFSFVIPEGKYFGLIFISQESDTGNNGNWNTPHKQTVDIHYDSNNNCYILKNKYSDNKIVGEWINVNLQNTEANKEPEGQVQENNEQKQYQENEIINILNSVFNSNKIGQTNYSSKMNSIEGTETDKKNFSTELGNFRNAVEANIKNSVTNSFFECHSALINRISNNTIEKATLKCKGIAKWDWGQHNAIFEIQELKPIIKNTPHKSIIDASICINKTIADGDITQNDILGELLSNNKLFYENDNKKYIFNSVDLNDIVYYAHPSKYYTEIDNTDIIRIKIQSQNNTDDIESSYCSFDEVNQIISNFGTEIQCSNQSITITKDDDGKLVPDNIIMIGKNDVKYEISVFYPHISRVCLLCLKCALQHTDQVVYVFDFPSPGDILMNNVIGSGIINNKCSCNTFIGISDTSYVAYIINQFAILNKFKMESRYKTPEQYYQLISK